MGLFGLFGSKEEREQGALRKLAKKLTERYGPPENRQKAIDAARRAGHARRRSRRSACASRCAPSPASPTTRRRRRPAAILVDAGEAAIGPIERFVARAGGRDRLGAARPRRHRARRRRCSRWCSRELARLGRIYTRDPEKKLVLLTWLRGAPRRRRRAPRSRRRSCRSSRTSPTTSASARRARSRRSRPASRRATALIQLLLRDRDNARVRGEVLEALRRARRRREGAPPERRGAARRALLPRPRGAREEARLSAPRARRYTRPVTDGPDSATRARARHVRVTAAARAARPRRAALLGRWFEPVQVPRDAPRRAARARRAGEPRLRDALAGAPQLPLPALVPAARRAAAAPGRAGLPRAVSAGSPRVRRSRRAFEDAVAAGDAAGRLPRPARRERDPFAALVRAPARPLPARPPRPGAPRLEPPRPEAEALALGRALRLARGAAAPSRTRSPSSATSGAPSSTWAARSTSRRSLAERAGSPTRSSRARCAASLHQHLAREFRTAVGPPLKAPSRVREKVLRDRGAARDARGGGARERARARRASVGARRRRTCARSRAATTRASSSSLRPLLAWIFRRLYTSVEVDEEGLARVKRAAAEAPIVLCPSHKSHVDYLVLSWLLYEHGMTPPHVAAGINLAFWPFGAIARRGGAFFIRRKVKGDRIYTAVLRAYVKHLLRDRFPQEFYVEGGRSRTGKLLFPKTGLVSMEVDAWLDGAADDVALRAHRDRLREAHRGVVATRRSSPAARSRRRACAACSARRASCSAATSGSTSSSRSRSRCARAAQERLGGARRGARGRRGVGRRGGARRASRPAGRAAPGGGEAPARAGAREPDRLRDQPRRHHHAGRPRRGRPPLPRPARPHRRGGGAPGRAPALRRARRAARGSRAASPARRRTRARRGPIARRGAAARGRRAPAGRRARRARPSTRCRTRSGRSSTTTGTPSSTATSRPRSSPPRRAPPAPARRSSAVRGAGALALAPLQARVHVPGRRHLRRRSSTRTLAFLVRVGALARDGDRLRPGPGAVDARLPRRARCAPTSRRTGSRPTRRSPSWPRAGGRSTAARSCGRRSSTAARPSSSGGVALRESLSKATLENAVEWLVAQGLLAEDGGRLALRDARGAARDRGRHRSAISRRDAPRRARARDRRIWTESLRLPRALSCGRASSTGTLHPR